MIGCQAHVDGVHGTHPDALYIAAVSICHAWQGAEWQLVPEARPGGQQLFKPASTVSSSVVSRPARRGTATMTAVLSAFHTAGCSSAARAHDPYMATCLHG